MDQQLEQREGKGGDRERGEELQERGECGRQKKREQSWQRVAAEHQAGLTALPRTNSSVACVLLAAAAAAAQAGSEVSTEQAVKLQALPHRGECRLPKQGVASGSLSRDTTVPRDTTLPMCECVPRGQPGSSASARRSHGARMEKPDSYE